MRKNRLLQINMAILFVVLLIFSLSDPNEVLIMAMGWIIAQVGFNIFLAVIFFVIGRSQEGKYSLISALIVLLVGFPACWGAAWMVSM